MSDLHPIFQMLINTWLPPQTEADRVKADLAYNREKLTYHRRNDAMALNLQIKQQDKGETI